MDSNIIQRPGNYIVEWGSRFSLKTLDVIHLTCFIQLAQSNKITFVSSDKRLCEIIGEMGYEVVNPETDNN